MNHFLLEQKNIAVVFTWNSTGLLTQVSLQKKFCAESFEGTFYQNTSRIPFYLVKLLDQLRSYFETGQPIYELPWEHMDQSLLSDFQKAVYKSVIHAPHGEVRTYSWVAQKMGARGASRAVGQALRKNPYPILIPCHRIISGDGSVGGFMGASAEESTEIQMKKFLLQLEEEYRNPLFPFLDSDALESINQNPGLVTDLFSTDENGQKLMMIH